MDHRLKQGLLIGVFLSIAISVEARPATDGAESLEIPNKSNLAQMSEIEPVNELENKGRETNLTKIHVDFDIPVQVIYDSPVTREREHYRETERMHLNISNRTSRHYPKQSNFSNIEKSNYILKSRGYEKYFPHKSSMMPKSFNEFAKNFVSVLKKRQTDENTSSGKLSLLQPLISISKDSNLSLTEIIEKTARTKANNESSSLFSNSTDEKYIIPILHMLEKWKNDNEIEQLENGSGNNYKKPLTVLHKNSTNHVTIPETTEFSPYKAPPLSSTIFFNIMMHHIAPTIPYSSYANNAWPWPPYYTNTPLSIKRQLPSPFAQYFPIVIRDPFQSVLNYFSDLVEYGPTADVCIHKVMPYSANDFLTNAYRSKKSMRTKRSNELLEKYLKLEYKHYPYTPIKYDNRPRRQIHRTSATSFINNKPTRRGKRDLNKNLNYNKNNIGRIKRKGLMTEKRLTAKSKQATGIAEPSRGTDVGPQISKLIVRRGGVAIAGAGGIATAGSGGTAIVGAGGTAFTTPASSGGVALVGPGGKVVNLPDISNILHGRTNANIAATGAGHATLTTKRGEVFTTSDNMGGMALVGPNNGILGVLDDGNFVQNLKSENTTNEIQLPIGARLLTTGPIIYYNPIYPFNQLRN